MSTEMAKSYSISKRRQNEENMKCKSYSKLGLNKNMTFSKKGHFLKPCHVSLRRIDMDTYSNCVKQSSLVSEQIMRISVTENDELYSNSVKDSCKNVNKFQKTSEVLKTYFDSESSVKRSCNTSASSSFVTFHDHSVVKPCYIKLERLNITAEWHHLHFAEKRNEFQSSKCTDYENRSSISESLTNVALLSQPKDTVSEKSDKSQQSSVINVLKPCTVRLSRSIDTESVSDMKHAVFNLDNCKMNQLVDFEDSTNESFISASLLSTPSSMAEYETNKRTVESIETIFPCSSSKFDANKEVDDYLSKSTSVKCKRLFFNNGASDIVKNEELRSSSGNQNAVKRRDILSPSDSCSSLDLDAYREIKVLDENFLKHPKKRKSKILSSFSSSDCSTVRNCENYSVDSRKMLFKRSNKKKAKLLSSTSSSDFSTERNSENCSVENRENVIPERSHKRRRNIPSKRGCSHFASTYDSSNDSSSAVNSSIAKASSAEQSLKKKHITLLRTSSLICNGTSEKINDINKSKLVLYEEDQNSSDRTNTKNENNLARECELSCSSEIEKNFSDNSFSSTRNSANSMILQNNQSKYSRRNKHSKRNHFVVNGTFSLSKVKLVSPDKRIASDLPENKSNYAEIERKCNVSSDYNIKPCYVILTREENIAQRLGEKSNNVNEDEPVKPILQVDCIELNRNKQIKSSRENKYKKNKSKKSTQRNRSINEKSDSVFVDECIKHRDSVSEKDCAEECTNLTTNSNCIHLLQDPSLKCNQQASSSKQCRKPICVSSSDSDSSLPSLNEILCNSRHPQKKIMRRFRIESDDSTNENCNQILNDHKRNIINKDVEEIHDVKDIDNASHRSCSPINSASDRLAEIVNSHDPDYDDAYLADTDDYSDSDLCAESHTANPMSQKNEKISAVSKENPSESENCDKSIPRKIPYRFLGLNDSIGKSFNNIFSFKSKTSGKVYLVDLFEYENIKKLFVTVHMKGHSSLNFNTLHGNNLPTVSERIKALGCFDEEDKRIHMRSPFIFAYIDENVPENEDNPVKILHKENSLSNSTNHLNGDHNVVVSANEDNSESYDICRESRPSCSNISQCKELTISSSYSDSSGNSDDGRTDHYCVHCYAKFSSKKENYNHTCRGKLQKGFLCIYCEKVYQSYSKLLSHKQLHLI